MTSWANLKSIPSKKKEQVRNYFSTSSDNYSDATLSFLYSFIYTQRNAEPYYVHDKQGFFQPLLKTSQVIHYLREEPTGNNYASHLSELTPVLTTLSLAALKRNCSSVFQYNAFTMNKINDNLSKFGVAKASFDVGIILDLSGSVPNVINHLKNLQKRTGKKSLQVFVMTNSMEMLQEFAMNGDPSWKYVSLMRTNAPQDKEYQLMKTMCELRLLSDIEYIISRFSSSAGKLIFFTSPKLTMENQFISIDGSSWKDFP